MAWALWLAVMLTLAMVEVFTVNLVFLMLAAGAAAGSIAAYVGTPVSLQLIVSIVVAVVMLFVVRPLFLKQLQPKNAQLTNVDALVGAQAVALEEVSTNGGRIRLAGEMWSARTLGEVIDGGREVRVVRIDGATAIVELAKEIS